VSIRVATALTDAEQESRVVHAVTSTMADAVIVRRCRDVVELRSLAQATQVDVVVVDGALRGLDRDVVERLTTCGVRLIAVSDDAQALLAIGVAGVVGRDLAQLSEVLRPVMVSRHDQAVAPSQVGDQGGLQNRESSPTDGRLIAVWGPCGAPGRTTVAIELAAALARSSRHVSDVLLVDLDTLGPSIAQLLGLIDDTSGLAASVRVAAQGSLAPSDLAALAVSVPAGFRVLVGLPAPDRWTELRPASTEVVLQTARAMVPWTVLDVGSAVEGSDLEWAEPGTPHRFGAARVALAQADVVVCVTRPDPVGLSRLLRELPQVQALAPTAEVRIVLNEVGPHRASQAASQLVETVAARAVGQLEGDPKAVSRAVMRGVPVCEVDAHSPFVIGIERIAHEVMGTFGSYDQSRDRATGSHRRLLRGTHRRHRRRDAGVV
jgi:Flp pilus assembly CpaE family ATPase